MSLVAASYNDPDADESPVPNNSFWPALDPDAFRATQRIDTDVSTARLRHVIELGIDDINRQLRTWQAEHETAGHITHDEVPLATWQTAGTYARLYTAAVFATAHALLLERYRDYSATLDTNAERRTEAKDAAANDYRRDARNAVSQILGKPHTTVELI